MRKRLLILTLPILAVVLAAFLANPVHGAGKPPVKKPIIKRAPEKKPGGEGTSKRDPGGDALHAPKGTGIEASPGQINARSAILIEVSTGATLIEQNADEVIEPASFTKVLTLYLVFESLQQGKVRLTDEVWISDVAWRTGGSKMFVGVGTKVPLEELIKGITVVSGNDACVAVAEHLFGSVDAFVVAMNRKAKELGMERSTFLNPHGLPSEGQVTTARDMAILGAAYLRGFPDSVRFHSMREYTYNNITQHNRNHLLLKDPSVDGLKTGFVGAAGYHLSATAKREGMRLLAVVMGAANPGTREREALKLLNFGFRYYALVQPFPEGQSIATTKVWKGQKDEVGLYPQEAAVFLIPQAHRNQLKWELRPQSEVTAPVAENQVLGEMVFMVGDESKRTIRLVSHEDIALAGWFKRLWHSLLQIHKLDWRWVLGVVGVLALVLILAFLVTSRHSFFGRSRSPFGR